MRDISALMRKEIALAKAEAKQEATRAGKGALATQTFAATTDTTSSTGTLATECSRTL